MRSAIIFLLFAAITILAAPIVELTIKERAGVNRVNEPVLMGVPLPEGSAFTDSMLFTLRDGSGAVIPCEFRVASRWLKNRSAIRWLHLDFQASVAASGTDTVILHSETAPYQASSNLTVSDLGTTLQVNTGVLRFNVKKANFNLLDEVWVDESGGRAFDDAHKIVATHTRGLIEKTGGVQYLSSNDAASQVVVERKGPMALVLKATGQLKSSTSAGGFYFITRIYAYNNSAIVKIENTIENRNPDIMAYTLLTDLREEIPLNITGALTGLVSRPGGYRQSDLTGTEELYAYAKRPVGTYAGVNCTAGGKLADTTFSPKTLKSLDIGWAALYNGAKGCAVGMKDFWRLFPTGIEVNGQGRLVAGLFSERSAQPLEIYAAVSRTQTTRFAFFNQKTPDELRALSVSADNPLYAIAPAAWYCRYTYGMGRLVEPKQSLFTPANWTTIQGIDNKINIHWIQMFSAVENRNGTDSYGYLAWGDVTHYNYGSLANPWALGWDGNYYDMAQMGFHHFCRTADPKYLDYAVAHANHIEDVHMIHLGAGQSGSNRYCPPNNHVDNDNDTLAGGWMENHTSHHKTQSMFENWWLMGDRRSLEVALEGVAWVNSFGISFCSGDNIATYERRVAHQLNSLYFGYYQTKQSNYFTTTSQIFSALKTDIRQRVAMGQDWMNGLMTEAVAGIYIQFSDQYTDPGNANYYLKDSVLTVLKEYGDWKYSLSGSNSAYGYALLSTKYGAASLTRAATMFTDFQGSYSNTGKDFAENGRSLELAEFYFALPDSVAPVLTEKRTLPVTGHSLYLSAAPNPFASSVRIRLTDAVTSGPQQLAVYDIQGRRLCDFSGKLKGADSEFLWKAGNMPSGVYLVRYKAGRNVIEKRITLTR